jgi:aspartate carbamoyltransferase catalytic subunit
VILDTAASFKEVSARSVKKVPTLRGMTIANLFLEPSTRTRVSFELAAKRLSADILNITPAASSISKGETVKDTARNFEAMKVDLMVVRHQSSGTPHLLAKNLSAGVINAGDGAHEHPTQGLLDLFTIREHKKKIDGLKVSIIGDIAFSRVARSNLWGLSKFGAKVTLCGPPTLMPRGVEQLGAKVTHSLAEAIQDADVLYLLRVQLERGSGKGLPSLREYVHLYGIDGERLKKANPDVLIMHPGPVNRGVELTSDVADGKHSVILDQVTNGIAVRMAVLYLLAGVRTKLK